MEFILNAVMYKNLIMKNIMIVLCSLIICTFYNCGDNKLSEEKSQIMMLSENEGEIFSPDRGGRTTMIKVSPKTGSKNLSMVIQKMPGKTRIPVHKHDHTEELFFVKSGIGKFITENDTILIKEGNTIYIPPGHWHGFENDRDSLYLVFVVTPPGLDEFFRESNSNKDLSPEQMDDIARKHDQITKKN